VEGLASERAQAWVTGRSGAKGESVMFEKCENEPIHHKAAEIIANK